MKEVLGLEDSDFLQIMDCDRRYYGGDQLWFSKKLFRNSACGTVALSNILAYTGHQRKWTKAEYIIQMEQTVLSLKPWHIFGFPIGIWPGIRMKQAWEKELKKRGMKEELRILRPDMQRGRLLACIDASLQRDIPIALLLGISRRFQNLTLHSPGGRSMIISDSSMHWLTVTARCENEEGEIFLKTSSWGGILYIRLSDWQKGFWPQCLICVSGNAEL